MREPSDRRWERLNVFLKQRTFRALTDDDTLRRRCDATAALMRQYGYALDESPDFNEPLDPPPTAASQPSMLLQRPFLFLFRGAYRLLDAWDQRRSARRTAPPARRPLRVLRIASRARQGGVAKVYLQSSLAMPTELVEYTLWPFGHKPKAIRQLDERTPVPFIRRKAEFWPGSYRFVIFHDIWKASRIIRSLRPDIVHVHEPQFVPTVRMAAALAGGVPMVAQLHSDYRDRLESIRPEMLDITRHALRRCHLLACSDTIRSTGAEWLGVPVSSIGLVEDGADDSIAHQSGEELRDELRRAAGGRTVIAMMSHIKPFKRLGDFLAACRRLIDDGEQIFVLLMCYGKPKNALRLQSWFDHQFRPHEGQFFFQLDGIQHLLPAVDIGVSTSMLEGLGLNILEYQMAGSAVVCTDIPAHREMVGDGEDGVLLEPGNVDQLVEKLRMLTRDAELRRRLADAGRRRAGRRRWRDTAERTARFYEECLGRSATDDEKRP